VPKNVPDSQQQEALQAKLANILIKLSSWSLSLMESSPDLHLFKVVKEKYRKARRNVVLVGPTGIDSIVLFGSYHF
jgi:hypothetical protein